MGSQHFHIYSFSDKHFRATTTMGVCIRWTGLVDWTGLGWTRLKVSGTILQLLESGCLYI